MVSEAPRAASRPRATARCAAGNRPTATIFLCLFISYSSATSAMKHKSKFTIFIATRLSLSDLDRTLVRVQQC